MDSNSNWHTIDCSVENVDKHARCKKCHSAYKHMNYTRHQNQFEVVHMPSLLPNVSVTVVSHTTKSIEHGKDRVVKE